MSTRIVVGMSGGVDSSLAAALLVEQGAEVIGVTMNLAGAGSRCCSLQDADDARRVAERLGIRFYVANYRERFKEEVMLPFADAYLEGRTPIPCVTCNKRFKFDHLLARARALGADAVATGHYARIEESPQGPQLFCGRDSAKDQSYFLFNLSARQLAGIRFPLGELDKEEVRARARELGLSTADKPESQEICFVPDGDYARVVETLRPDAVSTAGDIVTRAGEVLGRHAGIHHFTVGQRRGLGISSKRPLYVLHIDPARRRVVVGEREELAVPSAEVRDLSWTFAPAPARPLRARVRVRYRHPGAPATVEPHASGARLHFDEPVPALTPGQAAVFYEGERVLGGGWIERATA